MNKIKYILYAFIGVFALLNRHRILNMLFLPDLDEGEKAEEFINKIRDNGNYNLTVDEVTQDAKDLYNLLTGVVVQEAKILDIVKKYKRDSFAKLLKMFGVKNHKPFWQLGLYSKKLNLYGFFEMNLSKDAKAVIKKHTKEWNIKF